MKQDLIFGSITNYTWDQIEPWAVSIDRSGFTGLKAAVVYNMDFDTADELLKRNFTLFTFEKDDANRRFVHTPPFSIVTYRFLHMWYFLNQIPKDQFDTLRYIIATDVKDVVFQTNPSKWLEENLGEDGPAKINVGSEGLKYKDEPWGYNNMLQSFGPVVQQAMKDKPIVNAGTIAGHAEYMRDLFHNIWLLSVNNEIHNPDQAALNVLLSMAPWSDITLVNNHDDGWCCQAGTVADPSKIGGFAPNLLEFNSEPVLWPDELIYPMLQYDDEKGDTVLEQAKEPFCLVHQYDRVPAWKDVIMKKYREGQNASA